MALARVRAQYRGDDWAGCVRVHSPTSRRDTPSARAPRCASSTRRPSAPPALANYTSSSRSPATYDPNAPTRSTSASLTVYSLQFIVYSSQRMCTTTTSATRLSPVRGTTCTTGAWRTSAPSTSSASTPPPTFRSPSIILHSTST